MTAAGAPEILKFSTGDLALDLCPALGGSITDLRWRHPAGHWIELLRPTDTAAIARRDIEGVSCFPLTPYSNRVRNGRFEFEGREIVLPPDPSGPHAQHGHGWRRAWQVVTATSDRATLRLTHAADAWPFDYVIEQRFQLEPDGFEVELAARNDSARAMPFGFGVHPYFPRTAACRLTAAVSGFWETDNAFTGWQGRAVIDWPEHATRLTLNATAALRVLVIYVPRGEDYFCAEPVSNSTDAFNLAHERDDTGLIVLAPGQTVSARVAFHPESRK
jgi:aldose 1-epimerase